MTWREWREWRECTVNKISWGRIFEIDGWDRINGTQFKFILPRNNVIVWFNFETYKRTCVFAFFFNLIKIVKIEFLRKQFDRLIFKSCQVVLHFVQEEIAGQTIFYALNRSKYDQSILCDTRHGHPSSWTSYMEGKL